ncbi:MAG: UDP-N-acetylmuramate: L-alanyl-gamma-D-glutamyl-meso-diaminopimelate ligase [bacterium]|jgi:UDP-N-acetylmuramate: L-alanyl-gamma-D-glutamyl-meso-diaminopimelate ligase
MHSKHYHFSGICGTAMASLAVLIKSRGHKVTGSDQNVYPPMSTFLEENGIQIIKGYSEENLQPHPDFVVLGNVLSRGNPEVEYALQAHLHYLSMAEVLKNDFIRGNTSIVATGTHGKTTTTSIAAHVFSHCGEKTGFMIGGIPQNFTTSAQDVEKGGYFITEGDEYDTSLFDKRSKFFHYLPDRLLLGNLEFDHGDIFTDLDDIKKSFTLMLRQIPKNGLILVNGDDEDALEVAKKGFTPIITFGFGHHCDAIIQDTKPIVGEYGVQFNIQWKEKTYSFTIPLMGDFNVRNTTSVILLALYEGISAEKIQAALSTFKNTKRRLQELTENKKVRVFDDFAHHPTAIQATIQALRDAYPNQKIHAIYEPRSNTSVRRFHQEKMADAFQPADKVIFYKLHRAENIPVEERLDIQEIISELKGKKKESLYIDNIEQIISHAVETAEEGDLVIVMSQGGFEGVPKKLAEELDQKWK